MTGPVLREPGVLLAQLEQAAEQLSASAADVQSEIDHMRRQLAEVARQEARSVQVLAMKARPRPGFRSVRAAR